MTRICRLVLFVLVAVAPSLSAEAETCALDAVPAATLLVPYFEVDLDDANGVNTIFTVHNAAPEPALMHLILWTNWAAPTIDFDIYLVGYDTVSVSLRSVFAGSLPVTADDPRDTNDDISPSARDEWDIHQGGPAGGFPNCQIFFPYPDPVIQGTALDRLVNGHTGQALASLGGACLGADLGDNIARGYITIDNANECSLVLDPNDTQGPYFADGGTGIVSNVNQLWGEVSYVDPANDSASSVPLVHIEADSTFTSATPPSGYTFYGRYTTPDGRDNREPLGSAWGFHYNPISMGPSDIIVWRDPTANNILPAGAVCGIGGGTGPDWYPLGNTQVACFDEETNGQILCPADPNTGYAGPFPLATQRVQIGNLCGTGTPTFPFGWCRLNLNLAGDAPTGDVDFPSPDGSISQSVVQVLHNNPGLFTTASSATPLAHACSTDDKTVCLFIAEDLDCDTVVNADDSDPDDPSVCRDEDNDTCDDCSRELRPNMDNDGPDEDNDGLCDAGDPCQGNPDTSCVAVQLQSLSVE